MPSLGWASLSRVRVSSPSPSICCVVCALCSTSCPSLTSFYVALSLCSSVVFNALTKLFVMWFEDRRAGQQGYTIATSTSPAGPFRTTYPNVPVAGPGRIGDFDVFVDDDGTAYHVRTGFVVEKLTANYTAGTGEYTTFKTPSRSEGPVFFKRNNTYYILAGTGCCACIGGSSVYAFSAPHPLGTYTYLGEFARTAQPFDAHSPHNYETRAQASFVVPVPGANGEKQFLWMGNQWVTASEPGRPRNHDLLYWWKLGFARNGSLEHARWSNTTTISVPDA